MGDGVGNGPPRGLDGGESLGADGRFELRSGLGVGGAHRLHVL